MKTPAARRWATVLADAEDSELSLRAFARSRGLNPQTLAWWKWRLSQERSRDGEIEFVEAVVRPAATSELRVRVGEVVIEVEPDTDLELLARVVGALS